MKINRKVTFELSDEEINLFMKARAKAQAISNWGADNVNNLPKSAKPLEDEAYKVARTIYEFLAWMGVDVDELDWDFDTSAETLEDEEKEES